MTLWRISNYTDLKGLGGLETAGRWHNRGIPVVYLSEHPALCLLEVLVHMELDTQHMPTQFTLLEIEVDEALLVQDLAPDSLPNNWREDLTLSRSIGDQWLASYQSSLLKVPSAILPMSENYLFNPRHMDADKLDIVKAHRAIYDQRLF